MNRTFAAVVFAITFPGSAATIQWDLSGVTAKTLPGTVHRHDGKKS
jgi:hypothetical protein